MSTQTMIEVDGRRFDTETISSVLLDVLFERAPVSIMSEMNMRDAILARLRWAYGTLSLISTHVHTGDDVRDAASAAELHLEQALAMFRALFAQQESTGEPNQPEPNHIHTPKEPNAI